MLTTPVLRWSNKGRSSSREPPLLHHTHTDTDASSESRSRPCWPRCALTQWVYGGSEDAKGLWEEPPTGRYCAIAIHFKTALGSAMKSLSWEALCCQTTGGVCQENLFTECWLPGALEASYFVICSLPNREGDGNPLQCSCLENPRDGGAWWAAICGVAQSQTRLKRLSSSSSFPKEAHWNQETPPPSPGCFSSTFYWNSLTLGQLAEETFYRGLSSIIQIQK